MSIGGGAFRPTALARQYQRGGWGPGTGHQKHQMMNPTLFLYRFAGPRGPGPFTMKYWWTLGCFPTGREVPFRLNEFLQTYQRMHVPQDVEDWLDCFVKHPAERLVPALEALLEAMEAASDLEEVEGYCMHEPSVVPLLKPLREVEACLCVTIAPTAVRSVMADPDLRQRATDHVYEYLEAVRGSGSTPHRRAGYAYLTDPGGATDEEPAALASSSLLATLSGQNPQQPRRGDATESRHHTPPLVPPPPPPSENVGRHVGVAATVPEETSADERQLIALMTTFAEGAFKRHRYDDAATMMASTLLFCHDDDVRSEVHANIASARNASGAYKEAEFHGREAALLRASPRGYANWATAVAYQDDFERADAILEDALRLHPESDVLAATRHAISDVASRFPKSGMLELELRAKRAHSPSQQWKGIVEGDGRSFGNAFDASVFKHKLLHASLDPRNNELGSAFRRVGDFGHISSTKSMEKV